MASSAPTVLVVDDDRSVLSSLERGLVRSGYDVRLADSGEQALTLLEQVRPDVILLDILMPGGMDGYETCRRMQQVRGMETVPVVFVTAQDAEEDEGRAFTAGGAAFIRKPFDLTVLCEELERHLDVGARWSGLAPDETWWTRLMRPDAFPRFKEYLLGQRRSATTSREAVDALRGTHTYELARLLNIPAEEVARYIARFLEAPFVPRVDADDVVIGVLPRAFCEKNQVVPVRGVETDVCIVLANPFDWDLIGSLRQSAWRDREPEIAIASPECVEQIFLDSDEGAYVEAEGNPDAGAEVESGEDRHPVLQLAGELLRAAVALRASDLHLEPKEEEALVRLRIDGDMRDVRTLPREQCARLVSRFKALASMDVAERRKPQEGSVEVLVDNRRFKLRLATSSTAAGETLGIRLLEPTVSARRLVELGLTTQQAAQITTMGNRRQGMILVAGPTGSGKSTTIFSLLSGVDGRARSIISVEDPIEYRIPFANQQQVNERAGATFESLLGSAIGQDPDMLFVSEIRDSSSAKASLDFASSGHLAISSLHAANATTAIFRLERLGIERSKMADALLGIAAQKLVKKLCEKCKVVGPIEPAEAVFLDGFGSEIPDEVARPQGCPACRETGYLGREAVVEVLIFDSSLSEKVRSGASIAQVRQFCVGRGDYMIYNHAIEKVGALSCSPRDAYELVLLEEMRFRHANEARRALGIGVDKEAASAKRASDDSVSGLEVEAPEVAQESSPQAANPSGSLPAEGAVAVLVVEDDPVSRKILSSVLEKDGYAVTSAQDGVEALLELARSEFDLVISDINMPNLDGVKLFEMLLSKGIDVPVLFLTGDWGGNVEAEVLGLGAADFIRKPIQPDVLLGRARNILRRAQRAAVAF